MGTLRLGSSVVVPSVTVNGSPAQPVINPLSITPTTSQQIITAPSGVDGYSPITVDAVDNTIDSNIVASNIKNGVNILGVTGTYSGGGSSSKYGVEIDNLLGDTDNQGKLLSPMWSSSSSSFSASFNGVTDISYNALKSRFANTKCTSLSFPDLLYLNYGYALDNVCSYSTVASISMPELLEINAAYAMSSAFAGTALTNVSLPKLTQVYDSIGYCLDRCFANINTSLTASFPELTLLFGTSCAAHLFYFTDLSNQSVAIMPKLTEAVGNNVLYQAFHTTNLSVNPIPNVETIAGLQAMFAAFYGASFSSFSFEKLSSLITSRVGVSLGNTLSNCFQNCTNLTTLSFPALTSQSFGNKTNHFNSMLSGCSNVTVHFPSNLQSVIGSWPDVTKGFGGTNTTVLFDLPTTE